jgi:prepilin-type processing-associated H-X9-DG protein
MRCRQCGTENPELSQFCQQCGQPLAAVPAGAVVGAKTSGLAVTALVLGILCLLCGIFTAIPAIICGIIAMVQISKSQGRLKGMGMAIAGVVLPVILTFVMAILIAILLPALNRVKHLAQGTICGTNMQGLGNAVQIYMNDYDGRFPTSEQWCDLLIKEADVSEQTLTCPDDTAGAFSYAVNKDIPRTDIRTGAADLVILFEADLGRNGVGGPEDAVFRHYAGNQPACNVLFADGHVEMVAQDRIHELRWQP